MAESAYRDPTAGLRERIGAVRQELDDVERTIPWLLWLSCDPGARTRLQELHAGLGAPGADAAALGAQLAALEEALAIARAIVASAPAVEAALADLPDEAPLPEPFHGGALAPSALEIDEYGTREDAAPILTHLRAIDPSVSVFTWTDAVTRARFRARGVPFAMALLKLYDASFFLHTVHFALQVSVPEVVPSLEVAPMSALGSLGSALGLLVDVRTGHSPFDEQFRVVGLPHAVGLLDDRVRGALQLLLEVKKLRLHVHGGVARLEWAGVPSVPVFERAVGVLAELRAATLRVGVPAAEPR